jgi:hypothetical protein
MDEFDHLYCPSGYAVGTIGLHQGGCDSCRQRVKLACKYVKQERARAKLIAHNALAGFVKDVIKDGEEQREEQADDHE